MAGSGLREMFVGVGVIGCVILFDQAKKNALVLFFIDEIDAVGKRKRGGAGFSGGHDEREQNLNQMLVEMDGFEGSEGVIIIAATNRADVLDDALTVQARPPSHGRFAERERASKFESSLEKVPLAEELT